MKFLASFALAITALGPVAAPALFAQQPQPVRIVATGGKMATLTYTPPSGSTAFRQRTIHQLGGPVAEISIGFMNWFHSTSAEVANTNSVTITHAWLERGSTGQVVPLTFSGQRQLVMPASSTTAYHLSDPVASSVWTGGAPARDERFWLHVKGNIPAGGRIPQGTPARFSGTKFIVYNPANDPGTYDTAGAVPSISGNSSRTSALPIAFLGRYASAGHLSVIGLGDSILDGYSDTYNSAPVSGTSPLGRAAVDANGLNTIATMHLTRSGESSGTWVNHHLRQGQLLAFANVVVEEFGTNDIGQNGSNANSTTILGRLESIWNTARDAGVQKVVRTRLMPRTQSASTNWLSKADQTPNPGWGAGGARDAVNTGLAAALAAGKIDKLVDTLTPIADPTDDHYWLTNGTADYMTGDGTHPFTYANVVLAAPVRAALLDLTVDGTPPTTPPAEEIIIDNLDPAPRFTKSSGWATGTAAGKYGSNYFHDGDTRDGNRYALFAPMVAATGTYMVYVNWAPHANRATNTPIEVIHAGGSTPSTLDQTSGGNWHPLGEFTFDPDDEQGVFIHNTETNGHVIVDAVKFVPVATSGGGTPGTDIVLQSWTSSPWNAANLGTSFSAGVTSDGVTATFTFANPKTGVGITNPSAPNNSTAATSFFGHEGTGFGVGNNGLGRFDAGEQFTLQAGHDFALDKMHFYECDGSEVLHLQWTQNGASKSETFAITGTPFTFTNVRPDANTPVTITNVSPGTSPLNGRLRVNKLTVAYLLD